MTNEFLTGEEPATPETKPWYDGSDEDTVGYLKNKKWDTESPLKVLEAYRNLEKFHGVPADKILKLPVDDNPEAWGQIYNRLGRPETPDKYGYEAIKLPEGSELDKDIVSRFDAIFHKTGVSKSQRDAVLNEYLSFEATRIKEGADKLEQEKAVHINALKKEWGQHFDERVQLARQAFKAFLPEGLDKDVVAEAFENTIGLANAAKMFANLADKLGEDKFHDDSGATDRSFGYTREQAINDLNTLKAELKADSNRLSLYNSGKGMDYDKVMRLNKIISGA